MSFFSRKTLVIIGLLGVQHCDAFCASQVATDRSRSEICAERLSDRASFLRQSSAAIFSAGVLFKSEPSFAAKDVDPVLKGTKKDPKYEVCVSNCIYECTLPKGDEQKSRSECLPECKKKCATSKEQLMIGTPKA
eukprot:CAMPEP_0196803288 /NCGR_PEP_ID=MMETSP1362-20130617/2638_1 /TAXON_ID=163516 /ORGANISM="Leptocylindrus danicus, Strain CCMP1856" /LENGTH=134 /DNA_ID=CAMNT_0042174747 /DNA_START=68 /DNA_END=472 /DNA_ORIENTATION=+